MPRGDEGDFPQVVENMQAFINDRYGGWVARTFSPGYARWVCHNGEMEFTVEVRAASLSDAEPIPEAEADIIGHLTRIHPIGGGQGDTGLSHEGPSRRYR